VLENLRDGLGLVWNAGDRVQVYTHPLWMLTLLPFYLLTDELYLTSLGLSAVCSLAAVAILAKRIALPGWGALGVLVLAMSNAFVDYSTSGLENPLSHLLLVLLLAGLTKEGPPRLLRQTLLLALLVLNRMDLLLIGGPIWAVTAWGALRTLPKRRVAGEIALGFLPFIAWVAFALIYYGFPFPNSAYAKLGHGADKGELLAQGFLYFLDSLVRDPVTLPAIVLGIVCGAWRPRRNRLWPVALGILLYLVYTIRIGGDFMAGRFLAAPLLCAVAILARAEWTPSPARLASAAAAILLLGLGANPPTTSSAANAMKNEDSYSQLTPRGITNERYFYFPQSGLTWGTRADLLRRLKRADHPDDVPKVIAYPWIGGPGRTWGANAYILDSVAIGDPLLARLPARLDLEWKVGHWKRLIPDGMVESVLTGEDRFADRQLAEYAAHLRLITSGPAFSAGRFRSIWRMNTGGLDHLVERTRYQRPSVRDIHASTWDEERLHVLASNLRFPSEPVRFWDRPVVVYLDRQHHDAEMRIDLGGNDEYDLTFLRGRDPVAAAVHVVAANAKRPAATREIKVPAEASSAGFDRIQVNGTKGNDYFVGPVRFPAPGGDGQPVSGTPATP
jgi:arabinofuranosyltransferase